MNRVFLSIVKGVILVGVVGDKSIECRRVLRATFFRASDYHTDGNVSNGQNDFLPQCNQSWSHQSWLQGHLRRSFRGSDGFFVEPAQCTYFAIAYFDRSEPRSTAARECAQLICLTAFSVIFGFVANDHCLRGSARTMPAAMFWQHSPFILRMDWMNRRSKLFGHSIRALPGCVSGAATALLS